MWQLHCEQNTSIKSRDNNVGFIFAIRSSNLWLWGMFVNASFSRVLNASHQSSLNPNEVHFEAIVQEHLWWKCVSMMITHKKHRSKHLACSTKSKKSWYSAQDCWWTKQTRRTKSSFLYWDKDRMKTTSNLLDDSIKGKS